MGRRECRDEMETEMMYKVPENLGREIQTICVLLFDPDRKLEKSPLLIYFL